MLKEHFVVTVTGRVGNETHSFDSQSYDLYPTSQEVETELENFKKLGLRVYYAQINKRFFIVGENK